MEPGISVIVHGRGVDHATIGTVIQVLDQGIVIYSNGRGYDSLAEGKLFLPWSSISYIWLADPPDREEA